MDTQGHDDQLTEMRRELAELRAEVQRLGERRPSSPPAPAPGAEVVEQSQSRRQLFRGAAAVGAGVAVATIASRPAAAGNNDPIIIGSETNNGTTNTSLTTTGFEGFRATTTNSADLSAGLVGDASAADGFVMGVIGSANNIDGIGVRGLGHMGVEGSSPVANGEGVRGSATDTGGSSSTGVKGTAASFFGVGVEGRNDRVNGSTVGVRGTSLSPTGQGVLGIAAAGIGVLGIAEEAGGLGGQFRGTRAALYIQSNGTEAPRFLTDAHTAGEIQLDEDDNLWACVVSGTPGTWRLLAGPGSAGSTTVADPFRVFDSRFADGPIQSSESLIISVKDSVDVDLATLVQADALPEGATSIFYNITVTNTRGEGFLSVTPGDATGFSASSVNWTQSFSTVANGSLVKLDDNRRVKVFAGGVPGSSADFIIDITGYTI